MRLITGTSNVVQTQGPPLTDSVQDESDGPVTYV